MDKRYQVFVSSTYEDLQAERQEAIHALLELDCIPAGMELFPAADEDQWTLIRKVIDDCDYTIVIVAGRDELLGPDGMSYTEMEYRYALETGKPVMAFLHEDPSTLPDSRTEHTPALRNRLAAFRKLLQTRMCKTWTTPAELGAVLSRGLVRLIKARPAVGWVRADALPGPDAMTEIVRLRRRVDELQEELAATATKPPKGTEALAQGDDEHPIGYTFRATNAPVRYHDAFTTTWDDIFAAVLPCLMGEADERTMRAVLGDLARERNARRLEQRGDLRGAGLSDFEVSEPDFQTIKVQLSALGLVTRSGKAQATRGGQPYWALTRYGQTVLTRLRAVWRNRTRCTETG